jgi:hypothetical protein
MKTLKPLFLLVMLNLSFITFAQFKCNKWYFGSNCGLDFNTPTQDPLPILYGKTMDGVIGTSSISDTNSLLFYTDGTSVWNAQHQVMPNGFLLRDTPMANFYAPAFYSPLCNYYNQLGYGGNGANNSNFSVCGAKCIIVPDPGSSSKFYVFSGITELQLLGFPYRPSAIYYSKVNMNLNGGLGDVESSSKKTLLKMNSGTRNMCVVQHGNNANFWILTHGTTPNTLFAYQITTSGISTNPVVSTFPFNVNNVFDLKASSLGTRIAASNLKDSLFMFDFNKWTGVISNRQVIALTNYPSIHSSFPTASTGDIRSLELSPNAKLLYFSTSLDLFQLNLLNNNLYVIPTGGNGQTNISSSGPYFLQIGPNYKLYLTDPTNIFTGVNNNSIYIPSSLTFSIQTMFPSVINNPNAIGISCNYTPALGLTTSYVNSLIPLLTGCEHNETSLPNYITSMVAPWINTAPTMTTVNAVTKCQFDTLSPVSLIVADTETSVSNLTLTASSSNTTLLPNSNISIGVNGAQRTLLFSPIANQTGTTTITLQLTDTNGLSSTQSFMLSILPSTPVSITSTLPTSVCDGNSVVCSCAIPNNCSIEWISNGVPTGNTSSSYTVSQSANITALCTSSNGCTASSNAINVTVRPLPQVQCTINGPATICVGDSVQLQALSTAGYSYQWFKNTQLLPNANSAIYYAKQSGDYSYVATLNGCSKTSNAQTIKVVPAPIASITTPNTTVICNGQGALLQASTGTGYTYQWTMNGFDITGATNPTYTATIGSYYTVKVSNGYCARTSSPITITVNTAPVAIIHWNGTQLFSPISFYSYQWYLNGVLIPGATGQYYTPTQTGLYYVMVSNENGCKSLSPNYNLLTLSINSLSIPSLPIYPNPTSGMLQVDNFKEGTLYVYNAMGQLIIQQTDPIIDLSKHANGIYHIRAYNQAQELIGIGKVIKE